MWGKNVFSKVFSYFLSLPFSENGWILLIITGHLMDSQVCFIVLIVYPFLKINLFMFYLFFGCVGSSLLRAGFF